MTRKALLIYRKLNLFSSSSPFSEISNKKRGDLNQVCKGFVDPYQRKLPENGIILCETTNTRYTSKQHVEYGNVVEHRKYLNECEILM